jgi:hypothetical protein
MAADALTAEFRYDGHGGGRRHHFEGYHHRYRSDLRPMDDQASCEDPASLSVPPSYRPDASPGGMAEAERKAEDVFLQLLDRFRSEGRFVNHRGGPGSAATTFAKEPEANKRHAG